MKDSDTKRREAADRKARYDALTFAEKLALIKERPGQSLREYKRLMAQKEKTK